MDNCSDILENVDLLEEKMDRFQRNMDFYMRKITNTLTTFVEVISLGTEVVEALKSECRKVRQNPVTNNISNHHLPAIDDKKKTPQIKHTSDDIVRMKDIIKKNDVMQLESISYSTPRKTANKNSLKQSQINDISPLDSTAIDTSSDFSENPLVQSTKGLRATEITSPNISTNKKRTQTNKKPQEKTSETNNRKNATPSSSHLRKRKSNAPNVSISRKSPRISAHPPGYFQTKPAAIVYIKQDEESTRKKESRPNHSLRKSNQQFSTKKVVDCSTEGPNSSTESSDEAGQEQTGLAKSYLRTRQARKNSRGKIRSTKTRACVNSQ